MNTIITTHKTTAARLHPSDRIVQKDGTQVSLHLLNVKEDCVEFCLPLSNPKEDGPYNKWYTVALDRQVTVVGDMTCPYCDGSGRYYGRGYVENGVFKGFVGTCFRCKGTGTETRSDRMRNWAYDSKRGI